MRKAYGMNQLQLRMTRGDEQTLM